MRNIKFRGKDINNNWVYGYYHVISDPDLDTEHHFIINDSGIDCAVQRGSICEYTGFVDCNGNDIYEHDIVKNVDDENLFEVVWYKSGFALLNRNYLNIDEEIISRFVVI